MGTNYSEFKCKFNREYYDRFDYASPDIDPCQTDPDNKKNYKTPMYQDFGTKYQVYRKRVDWQQPGRPDDLPMSTAGPRSMARVDNSPFIRQAVQLHANFVKYTAQKAWECHQTYEQSSVQLCANEFKRHLFLADIETKWKFGSLIYHHNIDPVARIPEHLKYESDEFKLWLEQNSMSLMFPLYLNDYVRELNEY